jgi:hypothetical protein
MIRAQADGSPKLDQFQKSPRTSHNVDLTPKRVSAGKGINSKDVVAINRKRETEMKQ